MTKILQKRANSRYNLRTLSTVDYTRKKRRLNLDKTQSIKVKKSEFYQDIFIKHDEFPNTNIQGIDLEDSIFDTEEVFTNKLEDGDVNTENVEDTDELEPDQQELDLEDSIFDTGKELDNNLKNWNDFNEYVDVPKNAVNTFDIKKEWVSATKVKNYLLNDPIIDWLSLYYFKNSVDTSLPPTIQSAIINKKRKKLDEEMSPLSLLFEMGFKFEDEVINYLRKKFPGEVEKVVSDRSDIGEHKFKTTVEMMERGVPIIEQAMLYNYSNMTFGVADLVVRSDYMNKIMDTEVLSSQEEKFRAPKLKGNYHYRVIDIKWTTMELCSDGKLIRNSKRFPSYKGQLAIYNAAIGIIQGYTANQAYILAKSWKYTEAKTDYVGYNCFDLLGTIDYSYDFDEKYLLKTKNAIQWVRNVRYNGENWSCEFPPTKEELYPNMNNRLDAPYHRIKKDIAKRNNELTEIYMVGVKHRKIAHDNGVFKWSDPNCTPQIMGIHGKKVAPLVKSILDINNSKSNSKISPLVIRNNHRDWQTKRDIEFYVDFESINGVFYNKDLNLQNSKEINGVLFMIGVGYEEDGVWMYRCFSMTQYNFIEEQRVIQEFVDFIESRVVAHMEKYKIKNRGLAFPSIMHWGHVERTMFNTANRRHNDLWGKWFNSINWIDFCSIFKDEPIVIKDATKFGLKEIAKVMKNHGFIKTDWSTDGPADGLGAMIDATKYYRYMKEYALKGLDEQKADYLTYSNNIHTFSNIIKYNEIDCKTVWEIVNYLRKNNCQEDQ